MTKRQSNRPDRRIAPIDTYGSDDRSRVAKAARYVGSANHKLSPGDYGFNPPTNPRPSKSVCDGCRKLLLAEAVRLFSSGVSKGMMSPSSSGQLPKYIWAVDARGEVYEAKTKPGQDGAYHGYRLGEDERHMRAYIRAEWDKR
jgi:hypothetical protein